MDSTLKHLSQILHWVQDYWELIAAAAAFFGKDLFKKSSSVSFDKAVQEGSMALTPTGWESQRKRFEDSDPIRPR